MSILIKGVEMPIRCSECPCSNHDVNFCKAVHKYIPILGHPEWCSLAEVPTRHGRLIDADALYKLLDGGYDLDFDEAPETKRELLRMIIDAPTVIEAEDK